MSFLNTWQFNLLFCIIFTVFFNQFYKFAVKKLANDGAGTIILQIIAGLFVLLLIPLFPFKFSSDWRVYLFLAIACVFYAINDRLQTTIRKNLDVSVYTIINRLSSVFMIAIGLIVFREPFIFTKILGAILILLTNIILRYKSGKFEINKYFILNILACLSLAIGISIDVDISRYFNLPIYIAFTLIVPTLLIKVMGKIKVKEIASEFKNGPKKYFILAGISWALLIVFMIRAYQFGSLTLISPLSSTSVLINVLVATIFLGERKDIFKKILASLVTILGIYLTVLN